MVDTVFNYSSLMCQSMGNRFFFESILQNKTSVKFKEILLIAPDIDVEKFERRHPEVLKLTDKVFVFYNTEDRILKYSSRINKAERLGTKNLNLTSKNITFIECTHTEIKRFPDSIFKHMYFLTSKSIIEQINQLLR